jgi:hypothetical protein
MITSNQRDTQEIRCGNMSSRADIWYGKDYASLWLQCLHIAMEGCLCTHNCKVAPAGQCLVTTPSEAYRSRNLSLQKGFLSPCRFVNLGEQEDVLRSPSVPQFPPHCSVSLTITCLQVGDSPV